MKYDYVLLDLDGTITDSYEGLWVSMTYTTEKLGYNMPDREEFRKIIGPPLLESFKTIMHIEEKDFDKGVELFRTHFSQEGYKYFSVYSGIRQTIRSLKKAGIKVALATSKPIEATQKLLNHFGLIQYFDYISAPEHDKIQNSKEYVIDKALKVPHNRALMIGDRYFDANGAKKFNIDFMGVLYGFGSRQELIDSGAKYLAETPSDILRILNVDILKGTFISLEGMDGSGKSTQIDLLNKKLKQYGFDFINTREPGGTKISEQIREILLSCENKEMSARTEALLYAASRSQHVEERIKPNLECGKHVICDRFVDSSIAYQGGGRKLGIHSVTDINDFAIAGLYPHKTVYLDLPIETALGRRRAVGSLDRLEQEKIDFFRRTDNAYNELKKKHNNRIVSINANDTIQNIANKMFICVASALEPEINWENCKYE